MASLEFARLKTESRTRWLLISPALLVVIIGAIAPLLVIVIYSFLTPGPTGGVNFTPSFEAWTRVLFDRDLFDDTVTLSGTNLEILLRSLLLSLVTTLLCLLAGFPTAYFIATRNPLNREVWLLLVTVPFWTNLLIRTFAIQDLIRNEGIINTLLLKAGLISEPIQMLFTNFAICLGLVYVYLPLMILPVYASLERWIETCSRQRPTFTPVHSRCFGRSSYHLPNRASLLAPFSFSSLQSVPMSPPSCSVAAENS